MSHLSARGFQALYAGGVLFRYMRGSGFYFRTWTSLGVGLVLGTIATYHISERIACDLYYNRILLEMANRYNISRAEIIKLQTSLNKHYIQEERKRLFETNNRSDNAPPPK